MPSLPQAPRVCNETRLLQYPHKRVPGAKENRAAWVVERRGGSHPGARLASAENDLRASLKTKGMCEPAPSENEELGRVVSLPQLSEITLQKYTCPERYTDTQTLFTNVHNSMAPHSLSCLSADSTKWVPFMAGILLSHEEVRGTDTHYSIDGPRKHDAYQEKPDMKGWIVCDHVGEKCPEEAIHRNRVGEWLSGAREKEG